MEHEHEDLSEEQKTGLIFGGVRWLGIFLMLGIVLYLRFIVQFEIPLEINLMFLGLAAIFNACYPLVVRHYKLFTKNLFSTLIIISSDLIFITILVHFTGGVESPLILTYLLELTAFSLLGLTDLAYLLAGEATVLYVSSCILEASFMIPHYSVIKSSGTLYLSIFYVFSTGFTLFFTSLLLIYAISYLTEKFMEKQKKIEELSNAKMDFINQVIHEAKSPLTSIIGYADIMLKGGLGALPKELETPLAIIKRQSLRILNLSNELLDLARFESEDVAVAKTPVSFTEIIERAVEEMKPQLDEKKLELSLEFCPNPHHIPMDETKIFQVLINLLSNAVKFSNPYGKIIISTEAADKELQFSIRDEGMGIDTEDMPHIFEKFFRGGMEAADVRGTGLGLVLSKSIVEAHGGRMWVASAGQGKGAVFHFTLPL
jgi:signal transduction histidine kinase